MQATEQKPKQKVSYAIYETANAGQLLRAFFEDYTGQSLDVNGFQPILFYSTKFGQISEAKYFDYLQLRTTKLVAKQGSKTPLGKVNGQIIKILSNLSKILYRVVFYRTLGIKQGITFASTAGIKNVTILCDPARVQTQESCFGVTWTNTIGNQQAFFKLRYEAENLYQRLLKANASKI